MRQRTDIVVDAPRDGGANWLCDSGGANGDFPDDDGLNFEHSGDNAMNRKRNVLGANGRPARRRPAGAFTLIELLLVIAIIGLLLSILLPAFSRILQSARAAATAARVQGLADGAAQYYSRSRPRTYPGADKASRKQLDAGKFTGSQILAFRLFGLKDNGDYNKEAPKLVPYNEDDVLKEVQGRKWTIVDAFGEDMAILYFPARPEYGVVKNNATGKENMYLYSENEDYFVNSEGQPLNQAEQFYNTVADMSHQGKGMAYRSDYVVISAGMDQVFLTGDDAMNFSR